MSKIAKTGNEAMAEAMRQINPDVVAAYPITPATEIAMIFAQFVSDGLVDTEFVAVESEHSAMSATIAASSAGVRAMTVTSSQGLALMYEMLPIASGLRLPIVMPEVNRALSAPINIHCDHSDTMSARDFGWIQIFSENVQEAYDNTIAAIRISEHPDVRIPSMVTTDGFIISHCMEPLEKIDDADVKKFIGEYKPAVSLLNSIDKPITIGAIDLQNYYFEHRRSVEDGMEAAKRIIPQIYDEFAKTFGRKYDLIEKYKSDDAEFIIVALGSTAGTIRAVVDELRAKGVAAGLLKIRVFRPFPNNEIADALKGAKVIAVLDRSDPANTFGGPVFGEIRAALYDLDKRPIIVGYIYGLGGRDCTLDHLRSVYSDIQKIGKTGKINKICKYLGLRE